MLALSDIDKEDEEAMKDKFSNKILFYIGLGCSIFVAVIGSTFGVLTRRM